MAGQQAHAGTCGHAAQVSEERAEAIKAAALKAVQKGAGKGKKAAAAAAGNKNRLATGKEQLASALSVGKEDWTEALDTHSLATMLGELWTINPKPVWQASRCPF